MILTNLRASALALVIAASQGYAQSERYTGDGWSVLPPPGWEPLDEAYLKVMTATLQDITQSENQRYIAGFADPAIWPDGEYLLIQLHDNPFSGIRESELKEAFGALDASVAEMSDQVSRSTGGLVEDMSVGSIIYEADRRRVLMRFQSMVDGTPQETYSVLHPGKTKGIQLNWYSPQAEFKDSLPVFVASSDSFTWESGHEWTPRIKAGSRILLYAVSGALAGGFATLVMGMIKKRKQPA